MFLGMEGGGHVDSNIVEYVKCRALRINPRAQQRKCVPLHRSAVVTRWPALVSWFCRAGPAAVMCVRSRLLVRSLSALPLPAQLPLAPCATSSLALHACLCACSQVRPVTGRGARAVRARGDPLLPRRRQPHLHVIQFHHVAALNHPSLGAVPRSRGAFVS